MQVYVNMYQFPFCLWGKTLNFLKYESKSSTFLVSTWNDELQTTLICQQCSTASWEHLLSLEHYFLSTAVQWLRPRLELHLPFQSPFVTWLNDALLVVQYSPLLAYMLMENWHILARQTLIIIQCRIPVTTASHSSLSPSHHASSPPLQESHLLLEIYLLITICFSWFAFVPQFSSLSHSSFSSVCLSIQIAKYKDARLVKFESKVFLKWFM